MSKKHIYKKHFDKGRFYIHSDKQGGHPAYIYKKKDKKNKYYIIVFTSSPGAKRKRLKHSIQPEKVKISFVHKFPEIVKRRDLKRRAMDGIRIHKDDKPTIKIIERKK